MFFSIRSQEISHSLVITVLGLTSISRQGKLFIYYNINLIDNYIHIVTRCVKGLDGNNVNLVCNKIEPGD